MRKYWANSKAIFHMGLIGLCFLSQNARAYFETAESGEILKKGMARAAIMPQIRLSDGSGMNFTGFFDTSLSESTSIRLLLGGGETEFFTGGSFKWMPIPDYENQPAIGAKAEILYSRLNSESAVTLRIHPIVSKRFETTEGVIIPYASIPIGTYTYQSATTTPVNVVLGTEFISPHADNMQFGAELGLNASKSFSYISAFVAILIDENGKNRKGK